MSDAASGSIQFDTAVPQRGATASGAVTCAGCAQPITTMYYDVSGKTTCSACRTQIGTLTETPTGVGPLVKAGLFGLGTGIAGAILYYAVIAITNFEIGIVAIAIGYMVGWGVRKGAGGGGRRFQVMAVALTYAAVAMAYTPLAVKGAMEARSKNATTISGPAEAKSDAAAPDKNEAGAGVPIIAIVFLLGLIAALPVLVIIGSMPSGLISAAIIFFGMRQAWSMTARPDLAISGPYRVGAAAAPSA